MTITWKNNIIDISVLNYTRSKFCLSVTIFQQGKREGKNNYHKAVCGVCAVVYVFWNSLQNVILVVLKVIYFNQVEVNQVFVAPRVILSLIGVLLTSSI